MAPRLALLHTVVFLADVFRKLVAENLPNIDQFHQVDEGIIRLLMANGQLSPSITRRIGWQASLAQEAGADMILFTCSSTSPAVDKVQEIVDVPIMKIDEPLADRAVELGAKIGVVATARTTLQPSVSLIESAASKKGRKVQVQSILESEAFQAKLSGDSNSHDRLVRDAVLRLAKNNEVIVLAQASMAHLTEPLAREISVPVLSSPKLCIEALKKRFAKLT